MKLVTKYQIPVINSCWEKCDEKCAYMLNVYKSQLSRQTGSRNLTGQKMLPQIVCRLCWFLYTLNIYAHFIVAFFSANIDGRNLIFGHKLHIGTLFCGSIFWPVRFLLPVCRLSWFLYTFNIYAHFSSHFSQQLLMTGIWYLVTSFIYVCHIVGSVFGPVRFLLPICRLSWFLYTFNISALNLYKNQLSRQIGSRNLTGPKTLPTIWHTYMKLVTKYQIPVINSCWEKCDEKCAYMLNVYKNQLSRQAHFSSHFSKQLLMAEIWYLVTSFI
jgi:hypothetical protein